MIDFAMHIFIYKIDKNKQKFKNFKLEFHITNIHTNLM